MSALHKKRLLVLFWLVVAVFLLPPLIFGDAREVADQKGGDPLRNFIYDFQTLIGGGAAILAAWFTVRQMQVTDERSESRHRELVSLQLRADRLRVERLLFPALFELDDLFEGIMQREIDAMKEMANEEPEKTADLLARQDTNYWSIMQILRRPQFDDATDLLDGNLTYFLGRMDEKTRKARSDITMCISDCRNLQSALIRRDTIEISNRRKQIELSFEDLSRSREDFSFTFGEVLAGLLEMKKEYRTH